MGAVANRVETWGEMRRLVGCMSSGKEGPDYIQANVNGRLVDARQPMISPLDRGFLYGDALYEVWRTYHDTLFGWREHWERLEATATGLGVPLPFGPERALEEIRSAVSAWREATGLASQVYVRLQISRGGGPIGLDIQLADTPCFVVYVKALADASEAALDQGVSLRIGSRWRRNPLEALPPSLKTGNYLNNILGLSEARAQGADDVVFLNSSGALTEASTRNVWLVFKDRIATPGMEEGILGGVTRRIMLESIVAFEGRPLVEERLTPSDLIAAEECFLSSTTQDIQPVCSVDETRFPTGPGTLARRLKARFREIARTYADRETSLRL